MDFRQSSSKVMRSLDRSVAACFKATCTRKARRAYAPHNEAGTGPPARHARITNDFHVTVVAQRPSCMYRYSPMRRSDCVATLSQLVFPVSQTCSNALTVSSLHALCTLGSTCSMTSSRSLGPNETRRSTSSCKPGERQQHGAALARACDIRCRAPTATSSCLCSLLTNGSRPASTSSAAP